MQKVKTYLWFEEEAEEAMDFYVRVFNDSPVKKDESKIVSLDRYSDESLGGPLEGLEGKVAYGVFKLAGVEFLAFDGGKADFKFNESASLFIETDSQEETDYYWNALSNVPEAEACGWLKDKYGLSWQVIPAEMIELFRSPDSEKVNRAMQAMLRMKKINLAELRRAYNGE